MPSSGPMWHCYECNAEMRPLMMPDPHCASCSSTFVEMIDNDADDPRNFQLDPRHIHDDDEPQANPFGPGVGPDQTLDLFHNLMMNIGGPQRRASTIRIDRRTNPNSNQQNTTISIGGGGGGPMMRGVAPPPGGFFISTAGPSGNIDMIPMLNHLFDGPPQSPTAEQRQDGQPQTPNPVRNLLLHLFGAPIGDHDGQFGDYAVSNEALDRIITQLMEQTNGDKPVPAPDDMIARLPRAKVSRGSPLLQKDCAVCKDEFEMSQETIELPCKHVFHDECILPWIKQSGTCPVCRFELVPQPKHAPGAAGGGGAGQSAGNGNSGATGNVMGGGLFAALRNAGGSSDSNNHGASRSQSPGGRRHVPGGWHDLD